LPSKVASIKAKRVSIANTGTPNLGNPGQNTRIVKADKKEEYKAREDNGNSRNNP